MTMIQPSDPLSSVILIELRLLLGKMTPSHSGLSVGVVVALVVAFVVVAAIVVVIIVVVVFIRRRRRRLVKTRRIKLSEGLNEHCRSLLLF